MSMNASRAKYAQLQDRDGRFTVVLLDADPNEVGFGSKGPTLKRAEQDLKYWKSKGLEELPAAP